MFYPIMLNIHEKRILVVGGGEIAYRKSEKLLEFGGNLLVLSPNINNKFEILKEKYKDNLNFRYDFYNKSYLKDVFLVVAATSSKEINKQISIDCNDLGILSNVVDSKEDSDFIFPSIINNDNLTIAISTMGSFPYLSKTIRMDMEKKYKKFNKEYIDTLEKIRYLILDQHKDKMKEIMDYALKLDIDELKNFLIKLEVNDLK